jgi:transcription-repair coupling factor (superfamily II helicase)
VLPWHVIADDPRVKALAARIAGESSGPVPPLAAHGLWGSAAPILVAVLENIIQRPILYVTSHLDQADDARDDVETVLARDTEMLPAWETLPGEGSGSGEIAAERTRLCQLLRETENPQSETKNPHFLVAPVTALMQPVPSPDGLDANSMILRVGEQRPPEKIAEFLVERGFSRLDQVEQPGDFALRGGIMDVFATADTDPLRIEFFGDQIESIRPFEVGTQRSTRNLQTARITLPPKQALGLKDTTSFINYLPSDTVIVLDEPLEIIEIAKTVLDRMGNPVGHYPIEALLRQFASFSQLHLGRFSSASVPDERTQQFACESLPTFESKLSDAVQQLTQLATENQTHVFCDNEGEQERLRELVAQAKTDGLVESNIESHVGLVHRGFRWRCPAPAKPIIVLPHHELFRRYTQKRRIRKVVAGRPLESFLDLQEGDYVVHVVQGIARYVGMRTMTKGQTAPGAAVGRGKSEEYLTLRFADDAVLHVPVSQIDLVQKYIGARGARPILSKLGGTRWQSTKARVEEAVSDMAADLLRIQAVREAQEGITYPQDTHWQKEFETAFLYTETPDQLTALGDIKRDLARARPMDRLLCGDVGYGKTELAMRAAFKVIEFGKQVAVLVPTTVLAEQHHRTFCERMADYPFTIKSLNRYRTAKEQKEIVSAAKKGQVDIVIGTHRLLSKDVEFADLGLVIVDEEQRFGVEHKERLKHFRTMVEVLTLSATPIPRTLHMAMIGLRDISSLSTPPMDRRSISTSVCPWSDTLIREAINRELNREGQVFFVHNRVHSIQAIAAKIMTLVPEARVIIGHGQMHGDELEDVMMRFIRREADVLVSTSIIESGLDIPNANTMFIDRADMFGLADLHQLRGRVGRYKHRAYCYMLLSPNRPLTSLAAKRLKAIEEFSELGAGFRIAMRDLEIRGAGNILGPQQSGHIAAVGYELYCQLLEQSVKRMRGERHSERIAVHVELDVEAYIPRGYIASDRQRMECYRRVAACRTPEDVEQLTHDLEDAFGHYPPTVETLLCLTDIKVRAAGWSIKSIIKKEPDVIFTFDGELKKIEPLFAGRTGSVRVPDSRTLHWRLPENYFRGDTLLILLRNLLRGDTESIEGARIASIATTKPAATMRETSRPEPTETKPARVGKAGPVVATPNTYPADSPRKRRNR